MRWLISRRGLAAAVVVVTALIAAVVVSNDVSTRTRRLRAVRVARSLPTRAHRVVDARRRRAVSLEQRLALAQLAGQRIIYAYSGLYPPQSLLARVRAGEAAGVIFFGPNIASAAQLRRAIGQLQRANASSPVHAPLLMFTDQEGGLVRRLPGAPNLSEKAIGASPQSDIIAEQEARRAGQNMISVGLTVNLAPVLDVFRAPGNFIDQYQRSYSGSPLVVARLGRTFITELQGTGVAATAKHFPGLGAAAASQNTDSEPVTLDVTLGELRNVDEAPYRDAISAGVKLVMLSWAVYPALDPTRPAGLSRTVIGHELRGRLRFRGVTISDSLSASALTRFGGLSQRGVLAAQAGTDLLICSAPNPNDNTPAQGIDVLNGLETALATHRLNHSDAERAAARVIALRSKP